jgi:ketol-acid reductoisomerase
MNDRDFEEMIIKCYTGKCVAIVGYHDLEARQRARFLKNHGIDVMIGLRLGDQCWEQAEKDGFTVLTVWEAVEQAQVAQVW